MLCRGAIKLESILSQVCLCNEVTRRAARKVMYGISDDKIVCLSFLSFFSFFFFASNDDRGMDWFASSRAIGTIFGLRAEVSGWPHKNAPHHSASLTLPSTHFLFILDPRRFTIIYYRQTLFLLFLMSYAYNICRSFPLILRNFLPWDLWFRLDCKFRLFRVTRCTLSTAA